MKIFDIKNPSDWVAVQPGEALKMEIAKGNRRARLHVNASARVSLLVSAGPGTEPVLVGCSDGLFEVCFTADGTRFVEFHAPKNTLIFVRPETASQMVGKTGLVKFTNVENVGGRHSDLDRMMHYMRRNEERRDKALEAERQELREMRKRIEAKDAERAERKQLPKPDEQSTVEGEDPAEQPEGDKEGGEE
ncbi:hypothetical protein [Roseovarius amoyensis]|uniref:hypothetical protein n=1 Tax=Roseovarius amoyensis TaxID=2211448 RepID=UPI000DBE7D64|nr:hypothetical protein [Roseovarius amoyensis]